MHLTLIKSWVMIAYSLQFAIAAIQDEITVEHSAFVVTEMAAPSIMQLISVSIGYFTNHAICIEVNIRNANITIYGRLRVVNRSVCFIYSAVFSV